MDGRMDEKKRKRKREREEEKERKEEKKHEERKETCPRHGRGPRPTSSAPPPSPLPAAALATLDPLCHIVCCRLVCLPSLAPRFVPPPCLSPFASDLHLSVWSVWSVSLSPACLSVLSRLFFRWILSLVCCSFHLCPSIIHSLSPFSLFLVCVHSGTRVLFFWLPRARPICSRGPLCSQLFFFFLLALVHRSQARCSLPFFRLGFESNSQSMHSGQKKEQKKIDRHSLFFCRLCSSLAPLLSLFVSSF